jgi:arylsulfatase A-like enzyme
MPPGSSARTIWATGTSILPTMHGFDEFFGNLYHLNAEEEPELRDYPPEKDLSQLPEELRPRGVLHCYADGKGGQTIENTGPLTKKRMETIDEEFLALTAKDFIKRQQGRQTLLCVVQHHAHALPHPRQAREPGPVRPLAVGISRRHDRP